MIKDKWAFKNLQVAPLLGNITCPQPGILFILEEESLLKKLIVIK